MQRPQPLHSSVSTFNNPRSRFAASVISCSFPASGSDEHALRLRFQVMRTHGKVFQLLLEAGIGNGDERFSALAQRLAMQISDAVLSHHVVHIGARSNDAPARL